MANYYKTPVFVEREREREGVVEALRSKLIYMQCELIRLNKFLKNKYHENKISNNPKLLFFGIILSKF